jgi:hypothetical protein
MQQNKKRYALRHTSFPLLLRLSSLRDKAHYYLAEWTGLEPATPGVTGRYSNQLNYHSLNLGLLLVGADGIEPPTFAL